MSNKTLLIYPACLYDGGWIRDDRNYQPQLLVLYSYLKQQGMDVEVLEIDQEIGRVKDSENLNIFYERVKKLLSQYSFDIVGISCYVSACYLSTVMIAKICKELNKTCQVVVGGYHATAVPQDFVTPEGLFDYIVKGEGEQALLEICQGIHSDGARFPRIIEGIPRSLNQGVELYWQGYKYTQQRITRPISFCLTRGCPFRCVYCTESTQNFKPREYPIDFALRDIKNAVEMTGAYCLRFDDPLFPLYSGWGQELLKALAREDFQIPILFMTRIDLLKESHLQVLERLNVSMFFGIETCSEKVLKIMRKAQDAKTYLRKIEENLSLINNRGIFSQLSLIFNHPGESDETVDETINFLWNVYSKLDCISSEFCSHEFSFFPGTMVSEKLEFFEKELGTVIKHKEWWKECGNQFLLSRDVIPSREASRKINWRSKFDHFLDSLDTLKSNPESWLFKLWLLSQRQAAESDVYAVS